ncbi:hypothetical protein LWP59_33730 [Amycolatopsis acidiphila]|uniref:Uncharacterized protein n=1 Tax=Amycolatopsis acidiphila TaxID=715473 RepID=A0A558A8V3_9PSEU|nr:hypothetical protein [Amycolatopsis acidiphila]TVT20687.1 hypothetical protein FNH06_19390 [Amycolatopsis acidiphila]UIJ58986.1 hypothetical protein LWP59_33730 [Amycolatopsis acidiphila]GHG73169.1 hypothetical protein GCM10017788_36310 [Amycolatopsis acidiphila]
MTTATHSLDTTSGATTVAELLARNGARAGRAPHRRSRAVVPGAGEFGGTLPAFPPVDDTAAQYRYDKTTVAALLEEEPAAQAPRAETGKPGRAGLKIAGIAFAGAVLVGGWALANAQTPDSQGGTASGPVPSNNNSPESNPLLASAPVGTQVVTLASSSPTSTAEIPANTAAQQPDQGKFSGKLPTTSSKPRATAPAKKTPAPPKVTAPQLPKTNTWPANPYDYKNWPGGGHDHDRHHGPRR